MCDLIRDLQPNIAVHKQLGSMCLCVKKTAGSHLNIRFPYTPIQALCVSFVSSLCLPFPSLWAILKKVHLFDHKVFRAWTLHEVNLGTSPFCVLYPPT